MKTNSIRTWKRLIDTCLFVILISAPGALEIGTCSWSQAHGNEAHTAYADADIVLPYEIFWKEIIEYGEISGSPVVSGDRLVLLSAQSPLSHHPLSTMPINYSLECYTMDRNGLHLDWFKLLTGISLGMSPAIAGDRVICPSFQELQCYALETGYEIWKTKLPEPSTSVVICDYDFAVVETYGGHLHLIDTTDGKIVWTKDTLEGAECYFLPAVTAGDDKLFVRYELSDEEGIAAFNLKGELLWKKTGKVIHRYADDSACVTLFTAGILFVVGNPPALFALDGESGEVLWTYEGGLLDALTSDGKNIYIYSRTDESVLCLDVLSGKKVWKSSSIFPGESENELIIEKSIISTRTCVFICSQSLDIDSGQIFGIDNQTGEVIWISEELKDLRGPLILCSDLLIARTSNSLLAFNKSLEAYESKEEELDSTEKSHYQWIILIIAFIGLLIGAILAHNHIKLRRI